MWEFYKRVEIPLRVAAVIALLYLGYVFLSRRDDQRHWETLHKSEPSPQQQAKFDATYGGTDVKITQFFARDGALTEGQETVVCYGVVNAKSVKMDPPIGNVYPAINNCMSVQPAHDTTYTLTAADDHGGTKTANFTISVAADAGKAPKITSFLVVKQSVDFGKHYFTLSYAFVNAHKVSIDPPVFSPLEDSAPFGQTVVAPEKTTTYTLTVTGDKGRTAQKKLTVEVPQG